jgi:alkylation response protein AidB-like acyl-CoA dehydrogenase
LQDEILNPQMPSFNEDETVLATEMKLAQNAKKIALMILGTAAQKYMMALSEQQEILLNCADIIIEAYSMETAILRAQKIAGKGDAANHVDMAAVYCNDAIQRVEAKAKNTLAAMSDGDEARTLLAALRRFTKNSSPINTIAARQRIADTLIIANKYVF